MPAVITLALMATEHRGATLRDGPEDPVLCGRRHRAIPGEVGSPILLDNIGHFEERAAHGWVSEGTGRGNNSSGLAMADSAWGLTCR